MKTMNPKISIIIPIYNVEPYLRQCLDSVVNQTLQDIQIICVNDGSTDGSLAILREYEASDSRIEIIDKPNGGPSSARNAGISSVRGKYMYFPDSDDWIDVTLCEKAYYRLECTGADILLFFHRDVPEKGLGQFTPLITHQYPISPSRASDVIDLPGSTWNRVVRTSFFLSFDVRFPEVVLPEDLYMHWIHLTNEPHVELIPETLYYWRRRKGSTADGGCYCGKAGQAFVLIKNYLKNIGKYEEYRTLMLTQKFSNYIWYTFHPDAAGWLRESMDEEEMDFLRNDESLDPKVREIVLDLLGENVWTKLERPTFYQKSKKIERKVMRSLKKLLKKTNRVVFRPLENFVRLVQGKPKKGTHSIVTISDHSAETVVCLPVETPADRQIRELSELVCQLSKEVVELRDKIGSISIEK